MFSKLTLKMWLKFRLPTERKTRARHRSFASIFKPKWTIVFVITELCLSIPVLQHWNVYKNDYMSTVAAERLPTNPEFVWYRFPFFMSIEASIEQGFFYVATSVLFPWRFIETLWNIPIGRVVYPYILPIKIIKLCKSTNFVLL